MPDVQHVMPLSWPPSPPQVQLLLGHQLGLGLEGLLPAQPLQPPRQPAPVRPLLEASALRHLLQVGDDYDTPCTGHCISFATHGLPPSWRTVHACFTHFKCGSELEHARLPLPKVCCLQSRGATCMLSIKAASYSAHLSCLHLTCHTNNGPPPHTHRPPSPMPTVSPLLL
jgi:hypothetical protein